MSKDSTISQSLDFLKKDIDTLQKQPGNWEAIHDIIQVYLGLRYQRFTIQVADAEIFDEVSSKIFDKEVKSDPEKMRALGDMILPATRRLLASLQRLNKS